MLNTVEKNALLKIAREAIEARTAKKLKLLNPALESEALKKDAGAFVSLHKNGRLRGCIGVFASEEPLWKTIQNNAVAAAFQDPRFTPVEAEAFYAVHRGRSFFPELTAFMSSGKIFVVVLEAENAIALWRETMGATDPAKAAAGTIRREFGTSIQNNCTHGSDAPETAAFEVSYFFSGLELV